MDCRDLLTICIALVIPCQLEGAIHVSDEELKALSENLMKNDMNNVARYAGFSLQGRSQYESTADVAPNPLFSVDKRAYQTPTIAALTPLYDNYEVDAGKNEIVTPTELREESNFLAAVMNTTVMQLTKTFLTNKELAPRNNAEFKKMLNDIWFTIYSRGDRKKGSSAFEHVFLGEMKRGQISGLHNWLYFAHLEKSNQLNYLGWAKKVDFSGAKKGSILKVKYNWNSVVKPVSSMFVGTSPEFEMSLYTICFLARPNDKCNLLVGGKTLYIQTYSFNYDRKFVISSAYPNI